MSTRVIGLITICGVLLLSPSLWAQDPASPTPPAADPEAVEEAPEGVPGCAPNEVDCLQSGEAGATSPAVAIPTEFKGKLSAAMIRKVMKSHNKAIQGCYETELAKDDSLNGKLMVSFIIGEDGKVLAAEMKSDGVGSAALAECVLQRVGAMGFPAPTGGAVKVSYPIVFQSY